MALAMRVQLTSRDSAMGRGGKGWPVEKYAEYEFTYSQNASVVLEHM